MREQLSDMEFNAILHLTRSTHLDDAFDVWTLDDETDGFIDIETGETVDLKTGLEWLYDGIAYPLSHENITTDEALLIVDLMEEFDIGDENYRKWLLSKEND